MKERLKVLVLSSKLPEDIWLINKIADHCDIQGIVFPKGERFDEFGVLQVLKKTLKRSGLLETINQSLMYIYRKLLEDRRDEREMKKLFADKSCCQIEQEGIDTLYVEDINAEEVVEFLQQHTPELVVASGTSILKQHILEATDSPIINLHPGLAPQYRGRYGSCWPIYNQEPELVGVTIHFVDKGIDTGAILTQGRVEYEWCDYAKTITYKQHKLGGELMVECLQNFEEFSQNASRKTDCPSKNYRTMGLCQYLKAKKWLKQNRRGNVINERSRATEMS